MPRRFVELSMAPEGASSSHRLGGENTNVSVSFGRVRDAGGSALYQALAVRSSRVVGGPKVSVAVMSVVERESVCVYGCWPRLW